MSLSLRVFRTLTESPMFWSVRGYDTAFTSAEPLNSLRPPFTEKPNNSTQPTQLTADQPAGWTFRSFVTTSKGPPQPPVLVEFPCLTGS